VACLRQGERQVRIRERRTPEDRIVWEEVHASPILGPDGRLALVVEVWRDNSARRAAEARLADSHRLASLGVLASGFSHDLNTPLTTVLTCVEGLLRDARRGGETGVDASRVLETASVAREQILRCRNVTQHFLRLSRGQSSTGSLVDVGATVDAAVRLVAPTAHAAEVDVTAEPVPARLRVRADDAELQHALIDLLLNAIQPRPRGERSG
jgi:two-component system sensor histidine kinase AtoS